MALLVHVVLRRQGLNDPADRLQIPISDDDVARRELLVLLVGFHSLDRRLVQLRRNEQLRPGGLKDAGVSWPVSRKAREAEVTLVV